MFAHAVVQLKVATLDHYPGAESVDHGHVLAFGMGVDVGPALGVVGDVVGTEGP
jgi:hypothetical protein